MWSAGCVAAELLLGYPLFPGETGVDQLVEIIKVLGTPTKEEVEAMNKNYTEFKFPQVRRLKNKRGGGAKQSAKHTRATPKTRGAPHPPPS